MVGLACSLLAGCQSMQASRQELGIPPPVADSGGVQPRFQDSPLDLSGAGREEASDSRRGDLIHDVQVRGNETVPTHRILRNLRTRAGRYFDPDLLQQDIDGLWKMKEFRRINGPFLQRSADGLVIVIEVVERRYIRELRFVGNRAKTDRQLTQQIDLKAGQPLDSHQVRMARQQLEEFYHREGYPRTQVSIVEGSQADDDDVVFLIFEDEQERVGWVDFVGNQFASDSRLRTMVKAKPSLMNSFKGFAVDREQIEQDILQLTAYYRTFGYFNARIDRELVQGPDSRWMRIRYVIDEGPRYRVRHVAFVGNEKYSAEQLLGLVELKPAAETLPDFNSGRMNQDVNALRDLYGSEGHVFADVQVEPRFLDEPGLLDLVYKISEGEQYRVGKINVHVDGESGITKRNVVLNRLALQPGDIIDVRKIRSSERLLRSSQVFSDGAPGSGPPPRIVVKPKEMQELERYARDSDR